MNDDCGEIKHSAPYIPPGPAFIFYKGEKPEDGEGYRFLYKVPKGYIWQPATEGTGAGWVRPRGVI